MRLKSAKKNIPNYYVPLLVEYKGQLWLGQRISYSYLKRDRKYNGRYELYDSTGYKRNVWKHDNMKYKYV